MKFTILGCGYSMGVPRPDGFFGKCDSKNKKNYRTRCSALIQTNKENVLIDTSPDLRQQLLINKIKKINKVFYSHMHADQTHGINDLRAFFIKSKNPIDVYNQLMDELVGFNKDLLQKDRLIVRTKIDTTSEDVDERWSSFPEKFIDISSISNQGLNTLKDKLVSFLSAL